MASCKHYASFLVFISTLLSFSVSHAHRDSDIDNLTECEWNEEALKDSNTEVLCNDLYHLYRPKKSISMSKEDDLKIAAFNLFNLGSGDARFKDMNLTAQIMNGYSLVAVSEVHPSTSEEYDSNRNLKRSQLNFQKYYHTPDYLDLLKALQKKDESWALILSPSAQSENRELLGFYFKTSHLKLDNSEYCKSYNRDIREQKELHFSDSYLGPTLGRREKTPYLRDSYACLLDINKSENALSRVPFMARFKTSMGFDFNYLSYHARFGEPVAVGGTCGYECLEQINTFFQEEFHQSGDFIKPLDLTALRFLKNHLDYLSGKEGLNSALIEHFSPVIGFKNSKPRVYENMMEMKTLIEEELPKKIKDIIEDKYENDFDSGDIKDFVKKLTEASQGESDLTGDLLVREEKVMKDLLRLPPFSEFEKRYELWTSPEKVARYYELALVMKEMESVSDSEDDSDVLLGGDLNLELDSNKEYWDYLSSEYRYSKLAISSPTTISKSRGLVRSYDHFIYSEKDSLAECKPLESSVVDFVNERKYWDGFEYYFVKSGRGLEEVSQKIYDEISEIKYVNSQGEAEATKDIIISRGYRSCWNNKTYRDAPLAEEWRNDFECKTLRHYLENDEEYRIYTDLVSDHIPVSMRCNSLRDDD